MSKKINIEENKINHGFSVPENYFNELEVNVQSKIQEKNKGSFFARFKYPLFAFSSSAMALTIWFFTKSTPVENTVAPAQTGIDYVSYVNENIEEFDDELIYESIGASAELVSKTASAKDEAVEEYLLDEGVDEEWIIDEL